MTHTTEAAKAAAPLSLVEQRRSLGISLEAIAEATKIGTHFLRAIEADDFEKLPGGIYNTNYIHQYAAFTGLDELSILARYHDFLDSTNPAYLDREFGRSRLHGALHRLRVYLGKNTHAVTADTQQ